MLSYFTSCFYSFIFKINFFTNSSASWSEWCTAWISRRPKWCCLVAAGSEIFLWLGIALFVSMTTWRQNHYTSFPFLTLRNISELLTIAWHRNMHEFPRLEGWGLRYRARTYYLCPRTLCVLRWRISICDLCTFPSWADKTMWPQVYLGTASIFFCHFFNYVFSWILKAAACVDITIIKWFLLLDLFKLLRHQYM